MGVYHLVEIQPIPDYQVRRGSSGFTHKMAKHFSFFNYYTDYFPLGTLNEGLAFSEEAAYNEIEQNGDQLIMEYRHWSRLGEHLRITAFLPNAISRGSPEDPSIKLFNALCFTVAMLMLYWGFWSIGKTSLGVLLVLLINLTPYFLLEVFDRENIFGLLGTSFFGLFGLNLSLLVGKKGGLIRIGLFALATGLLLALATEFRNEISMVLLSFILLYLLAKNTPWLHKVMAVVLLCICFFGTKQVVREHYNAKFEKTAELVKEKGGHEYTGGRISGHGIWHPLFCGLGDFDDKYGYRWKDSVAYRYAMPFLEDKLGRDLAYSGGLHLDEYYDENQLYYIKFDEIAEYDAIMKDKVMGDITGDPIWYAGIVIKRIVRILAQTLPVPYLGALLLPLLVIWWKRREWFWLKFALIAAPLSITPLIIYSGDGATYNSVFGYVIVLYLLAKLIARVLTSESLIKTNTAQSEWDMS